MFGFCEKWMLSLFSTIFCIFLQCQIPICEEKPTLRLLKLYINVRKIGERITRVHLKYCMKESSFLQLLKF